MCYNLRRGDNVSQIQTVINIITLISAIVGGLLIYRGIYFLVGLFSTRKFKASKNNHKYAILVAARNEETVIGNLIESIKAQDYPSGLIDIFVAADNCTDNTAKLAREMGAICYERTDSTRRTKGYALQFLVDCIKKDYGIESYEGYFIFDADNLLKSDYVARMNDAFDSGEKIITSYRNTKNFNDNWISASYGIHWIRTSRTEHRARSVFRLATRIQGTGFLFHNELIKDGWNYTGLTEDRAFCADAVVNGYTISYNDAAEFYDEQPVDLKIALRQRLRWARGHILAFFETGGKLFSHIFRTEKKKERKNLPFLRRVIENIRYRIISYDMLSVVFPLDLFNFIISFFTFNLKAVLIVLSLEQFDIQAVSGITKTFSEIFSFAITAETVFSAFSLLLIITVINTLISSIGSIFLAAFIFFTDRKRIMPIKWYKKIWYCLIFPLFGIIGKYSTIIAAFKKVEWKPIPHKSSVTIKEIENV